MKRRYSKKIDPERTRRELEVMARLAGEDDADMAAVGRALMVAIETHAPDDWHPADCPSEIVGDLMERIRELEQQLERSQ